MSIILFQKRGLVRAGLLSNHDFKRYNLALQSETLDDVPAAWLVTDVTVSADTGEVTDPFGANNAERLDPTSANSFTRQELIPVKASTDYTFSVWLRAVGSDFGSRISIHDPALGLITAQVITVTGAWQRFTVTANSAAHATLQIFIGGGATWVTGEDCYAYGAQLNEGTSPLRYEATTDLQTIPDLAGSATLTRGANDSAAADDPTWENHLLVFDGSDDDVSGLTAVGSDWTIINVDEAQYEAVDSDSGSWINGVVDAGASEFDIGSGGSYTGKIAWRLQYGRVLDAAEHRRNYNYLKAQLAGRGMSI